MRKYEITLFDFHTRKETVGIVFATNEDEAYMLADRDRGRRDIVGVELA